MKAKTVFLETLPVVVTLLPPASLLTISLVGEADLHCKGREGRKGGFSRVSARHPSSIPLEVSYAQEKILAYPRFTHVNCGAP